MPGEPIQRLRISLRQIGPAFAVGLGLVGVLLWVVFLGWLLSHAGPLIVYIGGDYGKGRNDHIARAQ
jgi:hypothetical protein